MRGSFGLKLHHISRMFSVDMILWDVLVGIVSQNCVFGPWSQFGGGNCVLELLGGFTQRDVWLAALLETDSHWKKLLLGIDYPLHSDSVVNVTRDREGKIFAISIHTPCIPYFPEVGPRVIFVKQIGIDEKIIITVDIHIVGFNSERKINVIVFIVFSLWLVACYDHWISLFYVGLDPLQKVLILWLWLVIIPSLVDIRQLSYRFFCVLANQHF